MAAAATAGSVERAVYEDETGRRWTVLVPAGRPEDAALGVVVGPPDLRDALGAVWPEARLVALHNELQARGLLTLRDVKQRAAEVTAAIMAALRTDALAIMAAYRDAAAGE